jgi:hypothetical protein
LVIAGLAVACLSACACRAGARGDAEAGPGAGDAACAPTSTDGACPAPGAGIAWSAPEQIYLGYLLHTRLRFRPDGTPVILAYDGPAWFGACSAGGAALDSRVYFVTPDGAGSWTSEELGERFHRSFVGDPWMALTIDPGSGAPCVAYLGNYPQIYDPLPTCGDHDLLVRCRDASGWGAPTIAAAGIDPADPCDPACAPAAVKGITPALELGPDGALVVAYRAQPDGWRGTAPGAGWLELASAPAADATWTSAAVAGTAGGGLDAALAFDPTGRAVVAHLDVDGSAHLSRQLGATWETRALPSPAARTLEMTVAPDGAIYVALGTSCPLRLVVLSSTDGGGSWTETVVDEDGATGLDPSMRLTADGRPVVAYKRCGSGGGCAASCYSLEDAVKIAWLAGDGWHVQTVGDGGDHHVFYPSLDLAPDGAIGVAYWVELPESYWLELAHGRFE